MRLSAPSGPAAAAADAASDTLLLCLRSLGNYEISEAEPGPASRLDEPYLVAYALGNSVDYIVYGRVEPAESGFACDISVFDRSKGRTVIEKRAGPVQALELFEALDELGAGALEAMTGSHIGFGRLELANQGEAGAYRVSIDGINLGEGIGEVPRALSGRRLVRITQRRMLGDCEVAKGEVEVPEGGEARFEFAIPYCTEAERQRLDGAKAAVETALSSAYDDQATTASIQAYADLLADVAYSPRLVDERAPIESWKARALLAKCRAEIEASAWSPRVESLDPIISLYARTDSLPDAREIKTACEEDALLLACLLELEAGEKLGAGDYAGSYEIYRGILGLSKLLPADFFKDRVVDTFRLISLSDSKQGDEESRKDAIDAFSPLVENARAFAALEGAFASGGVAIELSANDSKAPRIVAANATMPKRFSIIDESPTTSGDHPPQALVAQFPLESEATLAAEPETPLDQAPVPGEGEAKLRIAQPTVLNENEKSEAPDAQTKRSNSRWSIGPELRIGFCPDSDYYGTFLGLEILSFPWLSKLPWLGITYDLGYGTLNGDDGGIQASIGPYLGIGRNKVIGAHIRAAPILGIVDYEPDPFHWGAEAGVGLDIKLGHFMLTLDGTATFFDISPLQYGGRSIISYVSFNREEEKQTPSLVIKKNSRWRWSIGPEMRYCYNTTYWQEKSSFLGLEFLCFPCQAKLPWLGMTFSGGFGEFSNYNTTIASGAQISTGLYIILGWDKPINAHLRAAPIIQFGEYDSNSLYFGGAEEGVGFDFHIGHVVLTIEAMTVLFDMGERMYGNRIILSYANFDHQRKDDIKQ